MYKFSRSLLLCYENLLKPGRINGRIVPKVIIQLTSPSGIENNLLINMPRKANSTKTTGKGNQKGRVKDKLSKQNIDETELQEDQIDEDSPSTSSSTGVKDRLNKESVDEPELSEDQNDEKSPSTSNESKKRGRTEDTEKPATKKVKKDFMNRTETDCDDINFSCEKTASNGNMCNLKIVSWNVAGIRSWVKKNGLKYIKAEDPDILCLQETKCSESKLPPEAKLTGYHTHWCSGLKEGYAGVGLYSKVKPLKVKCGLGKQEHDSEGRVITAEYEKFYFVTTYVPNAGEGLKTLPKRLKWDKDFRKYLKNLDEKKPVILAGDMNVAHNEIDLANPKGNVKRAGFTVEERAGMTSLLEEGFIDSFRYLYPDKKDAYTYWTYFGNARSRNKGWRLDYFILSERLKDNLCDNVIRNKVFGSDHCPIVLYLNIE